MNKNLLTFTLFSFCIVAILCASCNEATTQTSSQAEAKTIDLPKLLDRSEKIQLGKEWDYVQNYYMDRKQALEKNPEDNQAKLEIAQLFIKEARVTGEHGHYYPAALKTINEILSQDSLDNNMNFLALMTKAGVQLSLHEFSDALDTGLKAVKLNPANAQIYGVLVDANVELGNYGEAVKLADRMVSIKPDLRSYSRISYLREIHGDVEGAKKALTLAVEAGYPGYEETAWAMLTLGELYAEYGEIDKAEKIYEQIVEMRPNYPFAVAALGDIAYEKGEIEKAEKIYNDAIEIIPEVGFYISLAQIYKETGREDEYTNIISEIMEMLEDDVVHGHNMNLEYAHLYNDVMDNPDKALVYVKKEYEKRPENIDVNRVLSKIYLNLDDKTNSKIYAEAAGITNSKHPELKKILDKIN
mgnify:CR=1 FL=1